MHRACHARKRRSSADSGSGGRAAVNLPDASTRVGSPRFRGRPEASSGWSRGRAARSRGGSGVAVSGRSMTSWSSASRRRARRSAVRCSSARSRHPPRRRPRPWRECGARDGVGPGRSSGRRSTAVCASVETRTAAGFSGERLHAGCSSRSSRYRGLVSPECPRGRRCQWAHLARRRCFRGSVRGRGVKSVLVTVSGRGGHRVGGVGWSREASSRTERGSDDRGQTAVGRADAEGRGRRLLADRGRGRGAALDGERRGGADRRGPPRTHGRAGHVPRRLPRPRASEPNAHAPDTRPGTLQLRIPKLRSGPACFPPFLEPRKTSGKALQVEAMAELLGPPLIEGGGAPADDTQVTPQAA